MDNFIDTEFFQNQSTVLVKYLYVIYLFCGAIFYEDFVRLKFRRYLFVSLCVFYLFCTIPQFNVFVLLGYSKLEHYFDVIGFLVFIHHTVASGFLFYRKRIDFRHLLNIINETSEEPVPFEIADSNQEKDYLKKANILKICFRAFQSLILFHFAVYVSKISQKIYFYEQPFKVEDEESEFFIPFIWRNCNTTFSYIVAYNLSYFFVLPFVTLYIVPLILFWILSNYLKNRAIGLRNDIKFHSDAAFEKFQDYDQLEEQVLKRRSPCSIQLRDIAQHREFQRQEFMNRVHRWILIHQRLTGCVNQYQKCAKMILDPLAGMCVTAMTDMGYFLMSFALDNGIFIYLFVAYLPLHFIVLTLLCSLGDTLDDMSRMIYEAVYSTPWYHLTPEQQKVILNFLTLSQRTQTLSVFAIFSLNFELMPTILNEVYGYIGIMRLLVNRRKN